MKIKFNNEFISIPKDTSIQQLLLERQAEEKGYAVAVNQQFVPKSLHDKHVLNEADVVELFVPMQGG